MLRSEIVASVDRLLDVLKKGMVLEAIREGDVSRRIFAYHALAQAYSSASPADLRLFMVFELDPILSLDWWDEAFGRSDHPDRPDRSSRPDRSDDISYRRAEASVPEMHARLIFAIEKLPQLVDLLRQVSDEKVRPLGQINLLVPEKEDQASTPLRIINAIESVVLIYVAVCKLHNEQENTLALLRCDSGSDKSFDFTGLPQIIEQVKSVIFGIVDRVIFFREMKFTERVRSVSESLPILDKIAQMVEEKKLSPEQAELLRRDFVNGATKFLETGSLIPEINDPSRYNAHTLIQASPTLLLEGPNKAPEERSQGENSGGAKRRRQKQSSSASKSEEVTLKDVEGFLLSGDGLSDDERKVLSDLLSKKSTKSKRRK